MRFAWQAQRFRSTWCRCLKPRALNPCKGWKFHVKEVLLCSDHFARQLQEFVCLGSTFRGRRITYFWSIHFKIAKTYWNSGVKCLVNMSFLKQVSHESFVWALKFHFWRKSRRKASFFELQSSFIFQGSLAEKLCFWASNFQLWRSRSKSLFLSLQALRFWASKPKLLFEGSLAEKEISDSLESQSSWQPNHFNPKSFDNHVNWISSQLTTKIIWITHQLTTKSYYEFQISWQPNHLNLKSCNNQITWISNQLTTNSLESQINWQPTHLNLKLTDNPITGISFNLQANSLNLKSIVTKIIWISNQATTKSLTLNSFESDINWLSNQLNSTHRLPIGSLWLETSTTASCGRYLYTYYKTI